jgi:hypothetical protein
MMNMKRSIGSLFLLFGTWTPAAEAQQAFPPDVARFVEQRELCEHFLGEEPYDAERRKFLEKRVRETCTGTDARLAALMKKYKRNPAVANKLNEYEAKIE